jgi:hypothetical protein
MNNIFYVNVYENSCSASFQTLEDANRYSKEIKIGCLEITIDQKNNPHIKWV